MACAPELLARADAAAALPVLGGMARPDGVVVVGRRFWALARTDGSVVEGAMPAVPRLVAAVPLVRGLVKLGLALAPLARRGGAARPAERTFLLLALAASFALPFVPHANLAGLALTGALLAWLFRGRTLSLHGAEHRAIAAAEERRLAGAWEGSVRPSRFSPRCGTNFAALAAPVTGLVAWALPLAPVAAVLSLALTMELWQAVQARSALRFLLWPGLALQRLTTREPSLAETRVALRAVESVLRRELA